MSIDLKTARPVVQRNDGSYEPAESIDLTSATPVESSIFGTAKEMALDTIYNMPILGGFSPKQIDDVRGVSKDFPDVNRERSAAFKWFVSGMPEDLKGIEKAETSTWADLMRESPILKELPTAMSEGLDMAVKSLVPTPFQQYAKFPEGILKETLKEMPTELGGDLLEYGTDPVSWLMAYGMQVGVEKVLPAAMKKLSVKAPELFKILTKQRGNTKMLTEAFDELGLKPTASETEIRLTYRKQALKNHPDKGGNMDIFGKKADAYNTIMESRKPLYKEIQTMYKNSKLSSQRGSIDFSSPKKPIPPKGLEGGIEAKAEVPGMKERGFTTSVKAAKPVLKVAGQYIPRSTDDLAIKARTLIEEDIATAEKMAAEGTDDASIATGAELLKFYTDEAEKAQSPALKDAMLERATDLANTMAEKLTELGRSVQAASILTRMTPEGQLRFAAKTIKKYNKDIAKQKGGLFGMKKPIPEITPKQSEFIIGEMKAIQKMPDGEEKAIKFKELQDYISNLVPTGAGDKIISLWKTGLLSSPTTHLKNIAANVSFAGTEMLKDIPATVVDRMVSLISGKVTKAPTFKGYVKGVSEGLRKGYRFLKTGYDERNVLNKYDYKKVNYGSSKVAKGIQRYSDTIFRLLGAEDQPFYYGAKMRSLYEQAKVDGINKGLKGKILQEHVDNLVMNPTEDMALLATEDAKIAVFQNETALGKVARQIQKVGDGAAELVLPFGRTPSAVATQILNYTPAGAIKTIIQNMGKGKFDQKKFSEGMGRAITGTAVLGLGGYLFAKGMMNLDRPTTQKEKDLWEAEGRKANSINIGGKWRSIDSFGPAGNVLLIGGHFGKAFKKTGSVAGAMLDSEAYFGSIKSFTEQTFLTGVKQALEAVTDPEGSAGFFITNLIGSSVPSIVARGAMVVDPKIRRTENVIDKLKSRIPLLSLTLEPRVDLLGKEMERSSNFAELMLDPTAPQQMKSDSVVKELRRLQDAKMDVRTTKLGGRKGYESLTPEENTQLLKDAGGEAYARIKEFMSDKNYKAVPDDEKADRINEIFDEAKDRARVNMAIQITKDLSIEEANEKIKLMVKSKLLNRELYEEYLSTR